VIATSRNFELNNRKYFMKYVSAIVMGVFFSSALIASGEHKHDHGVEKFSVGEPGKGHADRRIEVSMQDDMRFVFNPALESIKEGETIEFRLRNDGAIQHEFSIGNAEDQVEHAAMMKSMPNMKHKDPNTVSLASGESTTLSWKFMGKDTVVFACNIPGHFQSGMKHAMTIGQKNKGLASS
jgi:uncharacterized cupredoxin-like copper-binding protein